MYPDPREIKLLVLDIDGTLVGESNQINPRVKAAVQGVLAQGIKVAIATGRMYRSALRFHQELELTLPLMAYQGGWIQTPGNAAPLYHQPLALPQALDILNCLEDPRFATGLCVHLYVNDQLFVQERGEQSGEYAQRSGVKLNNVTDWSAILATEPTKLLVLSSQPDLLGEVWQRFIDRYTPSELYLTRSSEAFVEAAHPAVNKGAAVQFLAETYLGLPSQQVMAIGDNYNDLEMLSYVGWGIAMGTAPAEVQQVAQEVVPSVEADGVAIALEKWFLS
ncbi:MAG: Cof-type HAD-IIB family hydrolase [Prochlorotrichaceae cyanobacterium]|jgi:Cof subfamily protein (haloacid dehalogenase superfamily)